MKRHILIPLIFLLNPTAILFAQNYVDDIYMTKADYKKIIEKQKKKKKAQNNVVVEENIEPFATSGDTIFFSKIKKNANGDVVGYEEGFLVDSKMVSDYLNEQSQSYDEDVNYDDDNVYLVDDNDDFVYTKRIKRYHNPTFVFIDPYYYDDLFYTTSYIGLGYTFSPWYHRWVYDPFYWHHSWCYDPFWYHPIYRPWHHHHYWAYHHPHWHHHHNHFVPSHNRRTHYATENSRRNVRTDSHLRHSPTVRNNSNLRNGVSNRVDGNSYRSYRNNAASRVGTNRTGNTLRSNNSSTTINRGGSRSGYTTTYRSSTIPNNRNSVRSSSPSRSSNRSSGNFRSSGNSGSSYRSSGTRSSVSRSSGSGSGSRGSFGGGGRSSSGGGGSRGGSRR